MPLGRFVNFLAKHLDELNVVSSSAVNARNFKQPGGTWIFRIVVRMAEARDEALLSSVVSHCISKPLALIAVLGHAIAKDRTDTSHSADKFITDHQ